MSSIRRIVSLVPSMTETVCMLGAGDRLVGATRYCLEPAAELGPVPRIGGTKNPKREPIAELRPDLVIANREENREEDIDWLRERFVVFESAPCSVVEAGEATRQLALRLGAAEEVQPLLLELEAEIARAEVESLHLGVVRLFYAIWQRPWMSANRDTYIHDMLRRAGAVNVCAGSDARYPELVDDRLADLGAELVLLPSEPFEFRESHRREVLDTAAFGEGVPVLLVDGRDFCWHGGRSGAALGRVVDLVKPFRPAR